MKKIFKPFVLIYKNLFQKYPKVGDKIITWVGFGTMIEGVVASIRSDENGSKYCWVDQFNKNKSWRESCIASFSYCFFIYV